MKKRRTEKQMRLLEVTKSNPELSLEKQGQMAGYAEKSVHSVLEKNTELSNSRQQILTEIDQNMEKNAQNVSIILDKRLKKRAFKKEDKDLYKITLDYHIKRTQPETPPVMINIAGIGAYVAGEPEDVDKPHLSTKIDDVE